MKKLGIGVGVALLVLVVAALSLPFLIDANQFRPRLESELSTALGREVKVGNLSLNIFGGTVTADDLTVADDRKFSTTPFLHARSLKLTIEIMPLVFSHKLNVVALLIDQPEIAMIQSAQGDWNFSGIGGKKPAAATPPPADSSAPLVLSAQLIKVTGARLAFSQLGGPVKPRALENMDVEIRDFAATTSFPFSMSARLASGGDIHLDGKAGPMNSIDAAATPLQLTVKLNNLQMAASGLMGAASGIDGVLSVDGNCTSDGKELNWNGKVHIEKLKLAKGGKPDTRPVEFDFALMHNVVTHSGTLSRGDIHLGNAPAHLTGTYAEHADVTSVKMRLAGTGMPVSELVSLLPPLNIQLPSGSSLQGGTVGVDANFGGPLAGIVGDASVSVNNTKLAAFDLGTKLSVVETLAGIKPSPDTAIEQLSAKVHITPEGQTIQDLKLVVPAIGNLDGAGTITAANALDFKMRATVHTSGSLMNAIGQKGDTAIPFFVQGTAENPSFKPDVKAIANEQVKKLESTGAKKAIDALGGLFHKKN